MATVQELAQDIFELVSRNTELDPSTPSGMAILRRYMERAFEQILSVRLPRSGQSLGGLLGVHTTQVIDLDPLLGTCPGGLPDASQIQLDSSRTEPDGFFEGWVCKITNGTGSGQVRIITQYDSTTQVATVFPAWTVSPDGTSQYLLTTRRIFVRDVATPFSWYRIGMRSVRGIVRMFRLDPQTGGENRVELEAVGSMEDSPRTDLGDPSSYAWVPGVLILDKAPEERTVLEALLHVIPAFPTGNSEEIPVPAPWEQAIALQARWWILIRYGETEEAFAAKKDLWDFLSTISLPQESLKDWIESGTRREY